MLFSTVWDIPAYAVTESWRDQIKSIVSGHNFGFFRMGLATKTCQSDVEQ